MNVLKQLAAKVEALAVQYSAHVEEIVYNVMDKELMHAHGLNFQDSITVVSYDANLEIEEDGTIYMMSKDGDLIKQYKRLSSAVKAL